MPRPEANERERRPSSVIVYAGASPKRLLFLEHAFSSPRFHVISKPGGIEQDTENVLEIARGKVAYAWHTNPDVKRLFTQGQGNLIIGTDLKTNPLQRYSLDIVSRTHSKGKPYGEYDIRKTMSRIARAAQHSDSPPFYRADAGTVLARREGEMAIRDNLAVVLDPARMDFFKTIKGFEVYKQVFADYYYSSQVYGDEEKHIPSLTDIAGGLSLGVLLVQDAVLEIGGVKKGEQEWRQAVKRGLYHVLISFSPNALRTIRPDIDKVIDSYPALETATALAMGEIPLRPREIQETVLIDTRRSGRTT